MTGREYCRMHGGTAPRGVACPAYKHGRYTQALTGKLALRYSEMQADPELLSMQSEASLLSARIVTLLEAVYGPEGGAEAGATWKDLAKAHDRLTLATADKDVVGMMSAIKQIGSAIEAGRREAATWAEVAGMIQLRARVVDTETKRVVAMEQMVKLDDLMVLAGGIITVLRDNIADRKLLAEVTGRIESMLTGERTDGDGRRAGSISCRDS